MTTKCNIIDTRIANISYKLANIPTENNEPSSLIEFNELNIYTKTKTVKDIVDAFFFPQVK